MAKFCAAQGCNVEIPKRMLMCLRHWKLVPFSMQARIWHQHLRIKPDGKVNKEWIEAKNEAVAHVRQLQIIKNEI